MYNDLIGTWAYQAGAVGTFTIPAGARVLQVIVHASAGAATLVMFGHAAIPVINGALPTSYRFLHGLNESRTGANTIVAVNTDSVFIEYVKAGNT